MCQSRSSTGYYRYLCMWIHEDDDDDCDFFFYEKWQGILINGQFPGPQIDSVTNDNVIVSVFNNLDEPFLLSWLVHSSFFFLNRSSYNIRLYFFLSLMLYSI